ncbi:DUF5018-related domain-containing protein [Chitinophaga arvensicola]|uniref:DUF5018 domain-containing protein n=1 Tax=Chitinophaga arvensicola TaxID=29529 RepID=A0A1I0S9I2_9BACT|nr:hypothetical protein [Chitinophaga arvensicola]SEW52746.1 hypothetical protein SAMN04488122_5081 [Chitinophaga arvensicola]
MNNMIKLSVFLFLSLIFTASCMKPRVDMDLSVWGDNANITAVVLFRYVEIKSQLGYKDTVIGYQNVSISTKSNTIDKAAATVNIVAANGTDLTKMGIRFSHFAVKIEPLDGAPAAGLIADFSKGSFKYRLYSADGTKRDWTVNISAGQ